MSISSEEARLRRWRLLLGGDDADGTGMSLAGADAKMDETLAALYDAERGGGLGGSLHRGVRNRRPRHVEIDWHRTIRANLRHWQPDLHALIPETRVGFGRKHSAMRDVILAIDQSGSMATSVVYAGVFAAVLASLPS